MKQPKNTIRTDGLTVTRDEATELMVHHLRLAQLFYEASPKKDADLISETKRIMDRYDIPGYQPPELVAALAWLETINKVYNDMKKDD